MTIHTITDKESKFLDSVSNKIYDHAGDKLDLSDERRDAITHAATDAMRKWLEEGR